MSLLPALLAGALVASLSATASAEPYPLALNARPLLLPANTGEAEAGFRMVTYSHGEEFGLETFDLLFTDLGLRGGLGPVELRAGGSLYVGGLEGAETVDRMALGAGMLVAQETAVVGNVARRAPFGDYPYDSIDLAFLTRRKAGASTAVQVGGGLRYDSFEVAADDRGYIAWAEGQAAGQAQLAERFGLDARVRLALPFADSYDDDFEYGPDANLRVAVRGVVTLPSLDLYIGTELTASQQDIGAERTVVAGAVGRLP
jgi:hypothetical protein